MNYTEAVALAGTLGHPSKMPGLSYGIPARACKVGSKLRTVEGSVCHKCYAFKGHYVYPAVATAQEKRLQSITNPMWVDAMVTMIGHELDPMVPFFRWHDAGDLQSLDHLLKIVEVARRMKAVKFWLPTREVLLVNRYYKKYGALHPNNLVIRVSAPMIDGPPVKAVKNTATVSTIISQVTCPAPNQGNECKDCRKCWDNSVANVAYRKH
jgi:hypothetical protein